MADHAVELTRFTDAGTRLSQRLALLRWCAWQQRAAPWLVLAVVAAVACALLGWSTVWLLGIALASWVLGSAVLAWLTRPSPAIALARWDAAANHADGFLSASCFEAVTAPTPAQRLHLERMRAELPKAWAAVPQALPLRVAPRTWLAPLLVVLAMASGLLEAPRLPRIGLDVDEQDRASAEAASLLEDIARLQADPTLSEAERLAAEELRRQLAEAAERPPEDREALLSELDALARQAEELAAGLDAGTPIDAALLAELERHADTAALAAALAAADLERAAAEAQALAERLERSDLSRDEQRRLAEALRRAAAAGGQGAAAQAMAAAAQAMTANDRSAAAQQMRQLGQQLAQAGARRQAGRRVQQMAQRLRSGGQRVLGGQRSSVQRLAQAPRASKPSKPSNAPLAPPGQPRPGQASRPGQQSSNQSPPAGSPPPVPGSGNCPSGTCNSPVPGSGQNPGSGSGSGSGAGQVPGSGMAAGQVPGSGAGGQRAGSGSGGPAQGQRTATQASRGQLTVDPAAGTGPSEQRQISGEARAEASGRARSDLALAAIAAEEEALDAEQLPLARREQVRTYFNRLRERLEQP